MRKKKICASVGLSKCDFLFKLPVPYGSFKVHFLLGILSPCATHYKKKTRFQRPAKARFRSLPVLCARAAKPELPFFPGAEASTRTGRLWLLIVKYYKPKFTNFKNYLTVYVTFLTSFYGLRRNIVTEALLGARRCNFLKIVAVCLLQGSILDSHVEVLNHRLRGLCDNVDCGQERFHERELVSIGILVDMLFFVLYTSVVQKHG